MGDNLHEFGVWHAARNIYEVFSGNAAPTGSIRSTYPKAAECEVKVTMMLADAAQAVEGKLYILGGGWSITSPGAPMAIAIKVEVPWTQANVRHTLRLALFNEDEQPIVIGDQTVEMGGEFEVGRPPGLRQGTDLDFPLAINMSPMPLQPGIGYVWRCWIDGNTQPEWRLTFFVRPPAAPPGQSK